MRVASSEIFSLMLSLRRRSTALCDSRRRRRFSFAMAALQVPEPYVTPKGQARGRTNEWTAREQIADGRTCVRDERARKKEARRSGINALFRGDVVRRGLAALLHADDPHAGHVHLLGAHAQPDAAGAGPAVERTKA